MNGTRASSASPLRALGYVGLSASDLAAWKRFAPEVLGLQIGEELADGTLVLRADSYKRRVFLHPGNDGELQYTGWEAASADQLDALRDRLSRNGVPFTTADASVAEARAVMELIQFRDVDGNAIEAFWGPTQMDGEPFVSPVGRGPFITGEQGLGHIVYTTDDYAGQIAFYGGTLGFKLSDYCDIGRPGAFGPGFQPQGAFFHVNPRHHSIAFVNFSRGKRFNHLMLEVTTLDDVGYAYERAKSAGAHILVELGRHSNDHMFSFYVLTPSGWAVEIGWGGIQIDDETWHVTHHTKSHFWGHEMHPPVAAAAG